MRRGSLPLRWLIHAEVALLPLYSLHAGLYSFMSKVLCVHHFHSRYPQQYCLIHLHKIIVTVLLVKCYIVTDKAHFLAIMHVECQIIATYKILSS